MILGAVPRGAPGGGYVTRGGAGRGGSGRRPVNKARPEGTVAAGLGDGGPASGLGLPGGKGPPCSLFALRPRRPGGVGRDPGGRGPRLGSGQAG